MNCRVLARTLLRILPLLAFVMRSGCGEPKPTRVNVRLAGLSAAVDSLSVMVSLDGQPSAKNPIVFDKQISEFYLDFAIGHNSGALVVDVEALEKQCLGGSGRGQVVLNGEEVVELPIAIAPKQPKTCPVSVRTNGVGRVTSQPTGIDCGMQCNARFAVGTQIKLVAMPDIPGSLYAWSGQCNGSSNCEFTVEAAATVGADFTARICNPAGWCWENPRPQGTTLNAVVVLEDTVFAAGNSGTTLRGSGPVWTVPASGTPTALRALWGAVADDVWAVGDGGVIVHWNGSTWTATSSMTRSDLKGVWGFGTNDVWAVGDAGIVLHWDGIVWSVDANAGAGGITLNAVWGSGPNDVWIVGEQGLILHRQGASWSRSDSKASGSFYAVWGSGTGDVWAVGPEARRWNGSAWKSVAGVPTFSGIWGTGPNTAWAIYGSGVWHWDGTSWVASSPATGMLTSWRGISGNARGEVWVVGYNGLIAKWNGSEWKTLLDNVVKVDLNAGWASSAEDAWVVGPRGTMLHWDGLQWSISEKIVDFDLNGVWGSGKDDVWVVGGGGTILWWNGRSWSTKASGTQMDLRCIAGNGPNDIWAAGPNSTLHWDGASWQEVAHPPSTARSIYVSGIDVWIAGYGEVYKWDGFTWVTQTNQYANALAGQGKDIFAIGESGSIRRFDGMNWNAVASPTTKRLTGMYFGQPDDAWASGCYGMLLHWNGTVFASVESGAEADLLSIFGAGPNAIWAIGGQGTILRYRR